MGLRGHSWLPAKEQVRVGGEIVYLNDLDPQQRDAEVLQIFFAVIYLPKLGELKTQTKWQLQMEIYHERLRRWTKIIRTDLQDWKSKRKGLQSYELQLSSRGL
jgi:hypothetical protein